MGGTHYVCTHFRFGTMEDKLSAALSKKLYAIGWKVTRVAVVQNEVRHLMQLTNLMINKPLSMY